jgi:segregation and condensation protein B
VNALAAQKLKLAHSRDNPLAERREEILRLLEALLFASAEPLDEKSIAARLPEGSDVPALLAQLREQYADRGVALVKVAGKWAMRTATDLSHLMKREAAEPKKLSRAAIETLAIVAYHQPVTRAEVEAIRGVTVSKGTLDVLIEIGWVRLRGRRRVPGRPVTYGTSEAFLVHFGLESIEDLPGLEELKGAGFLEGHLPSGFGIPLPSDDHALRDDEEELEDNPLDLSFAPGSDEAADDPAPPPRRGK